MQKTPRAGPPRLATRCRCLHRVDRHGRPLFVIDCVRYQRTRCLSINAFVYFWCAGLALAPRLSLPLQKSTVPPVVVSASYWQSTCVNLLLLNCYYYSNNELYFDLIEIRDCGNCTFVKLMLSLKNVRNGTDVVIGKELNFIRIRRNEMAITKWWLLIPPLWKMCVC